VIPAFNAEATIGATLASVFAQRYGGEIEVIVVNDGSTDGTRAVIEKFGDRIRAIDQENRGIAAARNTGIRAAAGEYLAFLDADDTWTEDLLAMSVPVLEKNPAVAATFADGILMDSALNAVLAPFYVGAGYDHSPTLDEMLAKGPWPILICTLVVRRETMLAIGGFAEEFGKDYGGEDVVALLQVRERGEIAYVPEKLLRHGLPTFEQRLAKCLRPLDWDGKARGVRADPELYFRGNRLWARLMIERFGVRGRNLADYAIALTAREQVTLGMMAMHRGDRGYARRCYLSSIRNRPSELKTYFRLAWAMLPAGATRMLSAMLSTRIRRSLSGPPFLEERAR
jgi:glycosyltransferase involved in cell wall biosynthesis